MKIAVQMDPIESIKIAGDTTFALMLEAQARGFEVSYFTPDKISMWDGEVVAETHTVELRDEIGHHYSVKHSGQQKLSYYDIVLLRQDPPADMHYATTTFLLERVHPQTLVINDPFWVRNSPEKILVTKFRHFMPPTLISRDPTLVRKFCAEHGNVVMKPLYGLGGMDVFRVGENDPNMSSFIDLFMSLGREAWVTQKFMPAVQKGDKRILIIDGKFGGALNRVPGPNEFRSNMVRGGQPEDAELTHKEKEIVSELGAELKSRGLLLAGIDVIGDMLTEINVTSPTGVRAVQKFGRMDPAKMFWDAVESAKKALATT